MEQVQEQKFVCKICSKSCFSGRSLGGHEGPFRSTFIEKLKNHKKIENIKNSNTGFEADLNASYGLRENPKQSWRVSDAKHRISKKHKNCIQCGKKIPSLRALSSHMRSHSIKSREKHKCNKGFDSMTALFGHIRHHSKRPSSESLSDYGTFCPIRRKRSKTGYKVNENFSLCCDLNESSRVSEIDEVEEAAMCLVMMSTGVRNWVDFNWVFNSFNTCPELLLEKDKSKFDDLDSGNLNFGAEALLKTNGKLLVCGADEARKMKELRERLDSCVSGSGNLSFEKEKPEFNDLYCGFLTKDEKNVELEVFLHEFKKSEMNGENGVEPIEVELERDLVREGELGDILVRSSTILRRNASTNGRHAARPFTLTKQLEATEVSTKLLVIAALWVRS
ncbi:uncharacterized protein LOC130759872 [Actinidia eriantha]|uniref:uncharacterized protein LOC130759872 n=1 Tax=Actinidia eriantha TaxID=165200 RepID=UPI0025894DBC|nr:uncharacterized protein LOC130759872 [Actinidia eriantha]